MASSPPGSPAGAGIQRPMSAMLQQSKRSSSRMSTGSRLGGGSRASDEDGKTAVKVAVRIRPPLKPDDPNYDLIPQRFRASICQVMSQTSLAVDSAQGKKLFIFDRVFGEEVDQEGIWEYLSESVNSFVQGYNVSILAYGQSGAGKSYTMGTSGPREQNDENVMGVIPRAAAALFEKLSPGNNTRFSGSALKRPSRYSMQLPSTNTSTKSADKNWQLKATYVEIYNEQLRDLLVPDTVPPGDRNQVTIREDTKGRILLTGLHSVSINSIEDLLNALNVGSSIRQTDATAINSKSSRSHAVFSLNLIQKKSKVTPANEKRYSVPLEAMSGAESWVTVDSKLHFVDLAGSERLKNTGAVGERAKEGISINAGLASLGKVISQLSSRTAGQHVSYRDSKLTRLLQDSLGGNAITYMVACVTPAEFHLSETLNTVQYAQRARAIQSKPQIQQVNDDSDKQAIIERLRAEVSFLRDQIRLSERAERRTNAPQERAERQHEREIELQEQLLNIQENYNALSQRHSKLIAEVTKHKETNPDDVVTSEDVNGATALERLRRSKSFAEAVENAGLVLEYEKTIQTLESYLSNTRSTLSSTENSLAEKETKIAYMENVTHQLQARIQKAIDREANNETYVRDLEARVDGITSGEEKQAALIQDLRKELNRVRENESSAEEYISTLEERLADAEQDQELMQREIDRLEHVIERQRSIGKLDNLLYELDSIRQQPEAETFVNGTHSKKNSESIRERYASPPIQEEPELNDLDHDAAERTISFYEDKDSESPPETDEAEERSTEMNMQSDIRLSGRTTPVTNGRRDSGADVPPSPAQSRFVADKLEITTQELVELRTVHETTLTDYEDLQRKYQIALGTLAEMQDAVNEARSSSRRSLMLPMSPMSPRSPRSPLSRPSSFLGRAGIIGEEDKGGQRGSSSRTLSSELSLLGESSDTTEPSDAGDSTEDTEDSKDEDTPTTDKTVIPAQPRSIVEEIDRLKKLNAEKEENMAELSKNYAQLQETHQNTLNYVDALKVQVQRAESFRPDSPSSPVIRRKSSQNIVSTDRANRSFAYLRNLMLDHFEDQPDLIQVFELNLDAIMTELAMRSERVQAQESEIATVRKEMETKMSIISGLTRERSSLKGSSPMDISVVAQMRDQLLESETRIRELHESHVAREEELNAEITALKAALESHAAALAASPPTLAEDINIDGDGDMPGLFPETPAAGEASRELGDGGDSQPSIVDAYQKQIAELQKSLNDWETKHKSAIESMQASETKLLGTITELELAMRTHEKQHSERTVAYEALERESTAAAAAFGDERLKHQQLVEALTKEVQEYKSTASSHAAKLQELEDSYNNIIRQVEEDSKSRDLSDKEVQTHRELVSNLEEQLNEHKSAISLHQQTLQSMQDAHAKELTQLSTTALASQADANKRLAYQVKEHSATVKKLKDELEASQVRMDTIMKSVSQAIGKETDETSIEGHILALIEEKTSWELKHNQLVEELKVAQTDLETARSRIANLESTVSKMTLLNEETLKKLDRVSEKEKKSARIVEELETQLEQHWDQHQAANNRLSALVTQKTSQFEEAVQAKAEVEKEFEELRLKIGQLESQLSESKRVTMTSQRESLDPRDANRGSGTPDHLRRSASHNSLPSPPPAIPLPPLPGSPPASQSPVNGTVNGPSPPVSRHQSKDIAQAQLLEDQEARIRTIEKQLFAEKQLTATLEEALGDLETSTNKLKSDNDALRKKCVGVEEELQGLRKERQQTRFSLQAVEEERNARMQAEEARRQLEMRMAQISKKKKKSTLNCF